MQTETLVENGGSETQKIKEPVTNNPRLVQVLAKAGFIVTNNDVIVKRKDTIILRKRINGENADGSPKYYDVPMQLPASDFAEAAKEFPTETAPAVDARTIASTEAIVNEMPLENLEEKTTTEVPSTSPEVLPIDEPIKSVMINGAEVSVGQVLETAPHMLILGMTKKNDAARVILLNMNTGQDLDIAVSELETVGSLPELERLFI